MAEFQAVDSAVNDLNTVETYIHVGLDICNDVAIDFLKNGQGEEKETIAAFEKIMLQLVSLDEDKEILKKAVQFVKRQDTGGEQDMVKILKDKLTEMKSDERTLLKHKSIKDFHAKINQALHPDEVHASVSADGDIEMTEVERNTRCPYTGKDMVQPVRNTHCGHNYEKEGIVQYIKQRGHKAKCPMSGCSNEKPVTASDLVSNKDLKRCIEKNKKK